MSQLEQSAANTLNTVKNAYLVLSNGKIFEGKRFGSESEVVGDIVFTTNMTGHISSITDSNFFGQIVVSTFPLVGNYGIISSEFESEKPSLAAYIVREWCQEPSNFRCEGNLDAFFKANDVVGLYDIDTRALTKMIREHGTMSAYITSDKPNVNRAVNIMNKHKIENPVLEVSCSKITKINADGKFNVVVWDFGVNKSIIQKLISRNCSVTLVPAATKGRDILALNPDGILLSNGPGDPFENDEIITQIEEVCQSGKAVFGIGLGHQMLALSQGAKIHRTRYGHRGSNYPIKDLSDGRVYITSQNNDFVVDRNSLPFHAVKRFVNLNDRSNEGIDYTNMPIFSVQFNPESSFDSSGTGFLYDKFIDIMKGDGENATE